MQLTYRGVDYQLPSASMAQAMHCVATGRYRGAVSLISTVVAPMLPHVALERSPLVLNYRGTNYLKAC